MPVPDADYRQGDAGTVQQVPPDAAGFGLSGFSDRVSVTPLIGADLHEDAKIRVANSLTERGALFNGLPAPSDRVDHEDRA